jgi:uncharacterized membrane protein
MSKKIKLLFLGSLTLNVLLVGVLLGDVSQRFGQKHSRRARMEAHMERLPEPMKARLQAAMAQAREENEPVREQLRAARQETIRILKTEPFDEAAYQQQVELVHTLRGQMAQRMADVVQALARELPLEQREALAELLRRPPPPPPPGQGRPPGSPPSG